jgi:hypothetical protein
MWPYAGKLSDSHFRRQTGMGRLVVGGLAGFPATFYVRPTPSVGPRAPQLGKVGK